MKDGYYYAKKVGGKDMWMVVEVANRGVYMFDWHQLCSIEEFTFGLRIPMPDESFEEHYKFASELGKLFEEEN